MLSTSKIKCSLYISSIHYDEEEDEKEEKKQGKKEKKEKEVNDQHDPWIPKDNISLSGYSLP